MMIEEQSMKRTGRWTSFVTRRVNQMRAQLIEQLGGEPTGRQKILLESVIAKYGCFIVLQRELRAREIVREDGSASTLIDRNVLAWLASLERSLALLFDGEAAPGEILKGAPVIDERFRSQRTENGQ